jgi:phosphohistidine phosphatase SixA
MTVYLVRHAVARKRSSWTGPDAARPLNRRGERQARELKRLLGDRPVTRVLSSPAVRCVDTVVPLANHLGLPVDHHPALVEGAATAATVDLIGSAASGPGDVVLCTHGDVLPPVLEALSRQGADLDEPDKTAKGSTWVLEVEEGEVVRGRYLAPPA